MSSSQWSLTLKLVASPGVLSPLLANLLALQRAEEPETQVLLEEAAPENVLQGIGNGRYDLGITWTPPRVPALCGQPLWHEELGIAVPSRSPLLAHAAIPLEVLRHYPLIQACIAPNDELLRQLDCPTQCASSFELMAVLVAAGYGVGVSLSSRISQAHNWGIVERPLAGKAHSIRAQMLLPSSRKEPAIDRFAERAAKITAASCAT